MTAHASMLERPTTTALSFNRTVERSMVHRAAVAEVFVTDGLPIGEKRVLVGAQLPLTHGYFGDHLQRPATVDPVLLLETARQAGIYGAHLLGIPLEITMLIGGFDLQITRPDALRIGSRPVELQVENTFEVRRRRGGRPRSGRVLQQLYVGSSYVGTHALDILVLSRAEHDVVRAAVREGPIPSTADMLDIAHPEAVAPQPVGRTHPANVVLGAARRTGDVQQALVAPRFGNHALFDHTYDHLPGLVLTEAARQLTYLALGSVEATVVGLTARFTRFAELDAPVVASTEVGKLADQPTTMHVTFHQGGTEVTEVTVTVVPSSTIGAQR